MQKFIFVLLFTLLSIPAPTNTATAAEPTDASETSQAVKTAEARVASDIIQAEDQLTAIAKLYGTKENSDINGKVILTQKEGGVLVEAVVFNVPDPGPHGFHVHEFGSCEEEGTAAGGHFNPDATEHGYLPDDHLEKAHAGDMGNIEIQEDNTGALQVFLPGVNLSEDDYNLAERAIVLHEKTDDFGQPTGNAGGRIACGVIAVQ